MKNLILCMAIMAGLSLTNQTSAQTQLVAQIGLQNNNARVSGIDNSIIPSLSSHSGIRMGLEGQRDINNNWSVVSGVHFVQKGISIKEGISFDLLGIDIPVGVEARLSSNNIEIPLNLKYQFGNSSNKLFIKAGTSVSYAINGNFKTVANTIIDFTLTETNIDYSSNMFDRMDISGDFAVGGEMQYGLGKIMAQIGYSHGLNKSITDPIFDIGLKRTALSLSLGYVINI